jgi:hypothetical protein
MVRDITLNNIVRTAPPPSKEGLKLLQKLYYKQNLTFGRDKLFKYIQLNYENVKISRRQVADWLKQQEINQLNTHHITANIVDNNIPIQKYKKGDKVRIYQPSENKSLKWSKDIYTIKRVYKPKKNIDNSVFEYVLEGISERFVEEDLQKIAYPVMNDVNQPSLDKLNKLVKPVTKNNKPHYDTKWVGYKDITIEPRSSLIKDAPKVVKRYENKNKVSFRTDKSGKMYVYTKK